MIEQDFLDAYAVLAGTLALWAVDIVYRSLAERKDAYRYILTMITFLSVTVLPRRWQMLYALCRFWYCLFRLGPRVAFLYNIHVLLMTTYECFLDQTGDVYSVLRTWMLVFGLVDIVIVSKTLPRAFKTFLWLVVRVIAYGVYALFLSGSTFARVYFGFVWFTQIFMISQLA